MAKIVIFGLGAVGATLSTCLAELFERYRLELELYFVVRNREKAIEQLFKADNVKSVAKFIEVADFNELESRTDEIFGEIGQVDICVNAAVPDFNALIQRVALKLKAHYSDMASDIYVDENTTPSGFDQQSLDTQFRESGLFALINCGISPGITNFLVGEKIDAIRASHGADRITSLNLYLLEDIDSEQIVFSWSPQVALEELQDNPRYYKENEMKAIPPFTESTTYEFPHSAENTRIYPLYQEELISFKSSYPEIQNMRVYTGGSEVELVKNLYQLNLLSDERLPGVDAAVPVQEFVKKVIPKMKSPEYIEQYMRNGVIRTAQFAAMAEIKIELDSASSGGNGQGGNSKVLTEVVGLSYHTYNDLLDTRYSGATYISYPTGVGAAITLFYSFIKWREDRNAIRGVLVTEQLPTLLGSSFADKIKRELSSYGIDLVSHSHTVRT